MATCRSLAWSATSAAQAPARLATLPFIEHDLVTFDYIELDDNSPP